MEDLADKIHVGGDGLLVKYVVRHELDATLKLGGHRRVRLLLVHAHVLDEHAQVGKSLSERQRDAAPEASQVDYLHMAEAGPVVVLKQVVEFVARKLPLDFHAGAEPSRSFLVLGYVAEVGALCLMD